MTASGPASPPPERDAAMENAEPIQIHVAVPHDYQTPFHEVVNNVTNLGMTVQQSYPDARSIQGSATPEVVNKLNEMGLSTSPVVRNLTWKV